LDITATDEKSISGEYILYILIWYSSLVWDLVNTIKTIKLNFELSPLRL